MSIIPVIKEDIAKLNFIPEEVLASEDAIKQRKHDLEKAMVLGNGYRAKARIVFETDEGLKEIETHIWATTDRFVILKGGLYIPVHCIRNVMV